MSFTPTPQQVDILDAAATGDDVVVEALAGTGKTSTLNLIARAQRNKQMTYVAFNRSIADEAKRKFPNNVVARTAHGYAFGHIMKSRPALKDRLENQGRIPRWRVAQILHLPSDFSFGRFKLRDGQLAGLVTEAVGRFCSSAAVEPRPRHIPKVNGLDTDEARKALEEFLFPFVQRAWADLISDRGHLRFTHDVYLKLASLDPSFRLPGQVILFDECQPTGTRVMVLDQPAVSSKTNPRRATVREVPIESLRPGDMVVSYDQRAPRLRVTGSPLSDVRSREYEGELVVVRAEDGSLSRYTPDHKCLAVVGDGLRDKWVTYLMRRGESFRVGITRGFYGSGGKTYRGVRARAWEEKADATWVLDVHETKSEALQSESLVSWQFGLPQMRFQAGPGQEQATIDAFWSKVGDLTEAAVACLSSHGRKIEYPFWHNAGSGYAMTSRVSQVRACNMLTGMQVIAAEPMVGRARNAHQRSDLRSVEVSREFYSGLIWSLEVEGDHTYVGDGLVTHNCQDADPVVLHIVRRMQQEHGAQIIPNGDSNQQIYCQPLGTMVEVPVAGNRTQILPIQDLRVGDKVVSYRDRRVFLGGRRLSGVNRFRYTGDLVRATTDTYQQSEYTDKHHCMIRFGGELRNKHVVYLMRRGDQFRIGRVPLVYDTVGGLFGPKARLKAEGADAAWILSAHDSAADAAIVEALASTRFGIPDACFEKHGAGVLDNVEFWKQLGPNVEAAERCLESFGRLIDYPLFTVDQRIGLRSVLTTAAANLIDGMCMLSIEETLPSDRLTERKAPIQCWRPIVVTRRPYDGEVISLEVEDCHTYFADGILTHNSWRGAIDSLSTFDAEYRLPLTKSFRFGPAIAEEANRILSLLPTDLRVQGHEPVASELAYLSDPDTVLCRTNAEAVARLLTAQVNGVRAGLVGGTQQVEWLAKAARDLSEGRPTDHPELRAFDTWAQVQEYVADEKDARDLQVLVRLVDRHGPETLLEAVERAVPEQAAQLLISTAHKAKGREWSRVKLATDFEPPLGEEGLIDGELRLVYVGLTRAIDYLDSSSITDWVEALVAGSLLASRDFTPAPEVRERAVARRTVQVAQVMVDPESEHRVIMTGTKYDPELVEAQRELRSDLRPSYRAEYCGFERVRIVNATWKVMQIVDRFGLSITDEARERIENYS